MTKVETLADGSVRMTAPGCAFLFTRVRPSVILTTITGRDNGELGAAPLQLIADESARFKQPVEWFVDAKDSVNASNEVFVRWTDWFTANQGSLKHVHVLAGTKPLQLTVSISRHLSRMQSLMTLYDDLEEFESALGGAVPPPRFDEPAVDVQRVQRSESLELRTADGSFTVTRPAANVLLTRITGRDTGATGTAILDEVQRRGIPNWFIDARNAGDIAPHVVANWTAWLTAHQHSFSRIAVLTPSGAYLPLVLTQAKIKSSGRDVIQIYRDAGEFDAALAARAGKQWSASKAE